MAHGFILPSFIAVQYRPRACVYLPISVRTTTEVCSILLRTGPVRIVSYSMYLILYTALYVRK